MAYLIDTHTLIWYAEGNTRLPERIRDIISDKNNVILVSHASIWKMTIKMALGKLDVRFTLAEWEAMLREKQFVFLSATFRHFDALLSLPHHHQDPFDRLMIAQAIAENFTIVTHDSRFEQYPVRLELF